MMRKSSFGRVRMGVPEGEVMVAFFREKRVEKRRLSRTIAGGARLRVNGNGWLLLKSEEKP